MKLKESKGISLIVFTIILAVLVVVAGGIIVYLINNPVKEGTTVVQTPTNVGNLNSSNEVQLSKEEALTKGNELYKKVNDYILKRTDNIENLTTSNAKKQLNQLKDDEEKIMFSIFNDVDVGKVELIVNNITNDTITFNVLHYNLVDAPGVEERVEYTFENAFKIIKENNQWVIDSVEGNRVYNDSTQNDNTNTEQDKEMTADERFAIYAKGLKQSLSKFSEFGEIFDGERYQCKVPVDFDVADERIEDISIAYNGDLHLKFKSNSDLGKKYGSNYKLASNIIKAGAMQMGQDVSTFIYAINDSGEFLYCRVEQSSNNNLKLNVISKLKNIVEIQRFSNGETGALLVAIDIDGKMYDIKDYI